MRYAIVLNGQVVNVVDYDAPPSTPPLGMEEGHQAIQSEVAGPGWVYSSGVLIDPNAAPSASLVAIKADLHKLVDDDAERVRMRYLTPGTGMSMTYAEKRDQANAVHAMGEAAANALSQADQVAQFPTLAASVGLEAPTLWACAMLVIAKSEAWATLSHAIERTRLLGKKAISDASDAASARAAYEAIEWKV